MVCGTVLVASLPCASTHTALNTRLRLHLFTPCFPLTLLSSPLPLHPSPLNPPQSGDRDIAEDLLRFFVDEQQRECFAACLYTCYDLIKPDVAMEVAWTNGLMDSLMPFLIQTLR